MEIAFLCTFLESNVFITFFFSSSLSRAEGDSKTEMTQWDLRIHNRKDIFLLPSEGGVTSIQHSLWPWAMVLVAFLPTPYSPKCSFVWGFIKPSQVFKITWKKNITELHWNWNGNYTVNSWREAFWCWNSNISFVLILYLK